MKLATEEEAVLVVRCGAAEQLQRERAARRLVHDAVHGSHAASSQRGFDAEAARD
jgi:hypothetical protein